MNNRFNNNQSTFFTRIVGFIGIVPLVIMVSLLGFGIVFNIYGIGEGIIHLSLTEIGNSIKNVIIALIMEVFLLMCLVACINWVLGRPVNYESIYQWTLRRSPSSWWFEHNLIKKNQK